MRENLIIDGNAVYEIDTDCLRKMDNHKHDNDRHKREKRTDRYEHSEKNRQVRH